MTKTWLITGASRGLGLEIARAALARGDRVVATGRSLSTLADAFEPSELLLTARLDVTIETDIRRAVEMAIERFGHIDVLVNNAGYGLIGAIEEVSSAEARRVFDVNVFGCLSVTQMVLPVMRAQRQGCVVNVSSVGGFTTSAGWGVYGASKFALEGISEALALELAALGIRVIIVEPGVLRTDFLDPSSLSLARAVLPDYASTAGVARAWAQGNNHMQPGDPTRAAAAILLMSDSPNPPLRLQLGPDSLDRIEAKLARVRAELEEWRELAMSTQPGYGKRGIRVTGNRRRHLDS